MKRIKIYFLTLLVSVVAFLGVGSVPLLLTKAEEISESSAISAETDQTTEETLTAQNESSEIILPVVSGFAGLAGAALLYLAFSGRLGKLKTAFDGIVAWFQKKGEDLATEEIDLKKLEEQFLEAVRSNEEMQALLKEAQERSAEEYKAMLSAVQGLAKNMSEAVGEMRATYERRAEEIEKQYHQIKDVLISIAAGNPNLVRSGVADKIVKTLEKKDVK
jgi:hypothetical protein